MLCDQRVADIACIVMDDSRKGRNAFIVCDRNNQCEGIERHGLIVCLNIKPQQTQQMRELRCFMSHHDRNQRHDVGL